jgi:glycosyltransferase involved in cell wall biosynthesis
MTKQSTAPKISVVIPCRNERNHIEQCLRSIFKQDPVPGDFEVIVADGISEDGTREILQRIARAEPRLRVIDNPDRSTSHALNSGIRQAHGRYVARMDAHNYYAPDYLCSSLEVIEETGADNVGGSMMCVGESPLQKAIAIAHHSPFSAGGARWHNPYYEGPADTVFGGFYRREVFDKIGFFDETLVRNQDDEFNLRLTRAGGKIWQSPRIKSWYHPRAGFKALFQQYMQYGYWKVRVIQKHRLPASPRHLVPGGFVLLVFTLPLVSLLWPPAGWIWLAMLGLYGASSVSVAAATAAKKSWRLFLPLPLIFACYHFGYGYGFLRGIIDFLLLRRAPSLTFTELTRTSSSPLQRV